MRVQISRASDGSFSDVKPVPDARCEKYTKIDIRCWSCVEAELVDVEYKK